MSFENNSMKKLIINADDFGFSQGVNKGIVECHNNGVVTSATLAVNMPFALAAVEAAKTLPSLGVGIHLNIVRGKPVLPIAEIPDLVDDSGLFRYKFLDLLPIQIHRPSGILKQIEAEYRAQIGQALAWGLHPTHFDSERHHACWPVLFKLMAKLACEYKIPALRLQREPLSWGMFLGGYKPFTHTMILRLLLMRADRILNRYGLKATRRFYGTTHIGGINKKYILGIAETMPPGICELMTHPGYFDQDAPEEAGSYLDARREGELQALTSPGLRDCLEDAGVELVNYNIFAGKPAAG